MTAGKEFGGHFVLGHVDGTGTVTAINPDGESWRYVVHIPKEIAHHVVSKGSITIDGISLTIAASNAFAGSSVQGVAVELAIIPYTYEHTNIRERKPGDVVNLEFDILGKYVERYLSARAESPAQPLTISQLVDQGF